jgi:hypothetical protein
MYAKPPSVNGAALIKSVLLIVRLRSELYQSNKTCSTSHVGSSSGGGPSSEALFTLLLGLEDLKKVK